ncbi:exonuclease SbcCD subunit D C-terminal domain-containing protein [Psychrobacter sp. AOP22-C1-22]|uniref:exonuclease SbcCD subunit D C-terminal domain-containing protein n=1 Tax=unclassified Psychrobacter TaxID=196806 RepID=UPI001787F7EA|nr:MULTISPECIES: exonuclease SbcCD subunit D C-terminal domain-containing protein [unclassified Psychrobacter]MBE0405380.1 exonuclease SbcCD subunit D C-terminal domain-containing protein [Psychrobacter sp. FME6]MBE0443694.1 exonuclease SbcCD subunit D C-terminal domain-containing protein [Psychrobacter sp. FME5]MDN5800906.1 exonuclease SbcCD subunit D C-terminal domain-containing protein [Psychrobacter sp.]
MPASAIKPLTILHTSDWHLGRRLYGRMRYEEFEAFLSWLQETISTQKVDVLIVAGDIFDTMTPSNRAQALYYEFLGKVSKSCCQHIVIVAGNHDSPTFLDAPSNVLKFLNVHVIGTACEDLNDEVLVLDDADGTAHCIIAAVPYLRDRDVRNSHAGESVDSKDANVIAGICTHYDEVASIAKTKQAELAKAHKRHIPIIATGHLFAAGGTTTDDDGVRDLYVGSLGKVSADMFDDGFDYVALGHLHVPQRVGGRESIRYSGSPIAMGFGEAKQQKQVLLVQFGVAENDVEDEVLASEVAIEHSLAPIKETTKKIAAQTSEFMDDLFSFEELVENSESDKKLIDEEVSNRAEFILNTETSNLLHHDKSRQMQIVSLPIPKFQKLAQVSGDLATIKQMIDRTIDALTESVWLEVVYDGDEVVSDLREHIQAMVEGLPCEVLKIKNTQTYNKVLNQHQASETLQDLNEQEVFERCLTAHNVPDEQKTTLRDAYEQIVYNLHHEDTQAE